MILLNRVTKYYDDVKAVDSVSLEVTAGSPAVILGPSGSGKTTLLRLIAGLELPDEGEIQIDGQLASKAGWALAPYRRRLGIVFQSSALWPHMTVAQNITFGLHGIPKNKVRHRLEELLEKMSLQGLGHRYPHQISGGEARRVALARTLAPQPGCILMDEPLTNVDPELKEKLLDLIKETILRTKACLLYVTHDADEARNIAKRVVMLKDGCLEVQER